MWLGMMTAVGRVYLDYLDISFLLFVWMGAPVKTDWKKNHTRLKLHQKKETQSNGEKEGIYPHVLYFKYIKK